ncbi:MAG: heparinase II/III family protein [Planctomycetota bacterium]
MTEAFRRSAEARHFADAPSGQWWAFADSFGRNRLEPALLWFAGVDHRPDLAASVWRQTQRLDAYLAELGSPVQRWLLPLTLVWPAPPKEHVVARPPKAWHGRGVVPVAILRDDDASDPSSTGVYVGIKGGSPSVNHAHMDIGGFVAELAGQRWAIDLGGETYERAEAHFKPTGRSFWDMTDSSPRWSLARYHNAGHNTLTIGNAQQNTDATATFLSVTDEPNPTATLDLSPTYQGQAQRVLRTVHVLGSDRILFEDQLEGVAKASDVIWTWITDAQVDAESDHRLKLTLDGVSVWLRTQNGSADQPRFAVEPFDAKRQPFESPNPGVTRIRLISPPNPAGQHAFRVTLTSEAPAET